jgi:hypothetical protein
VKDTFDKDEWIVERKISHNECQPPHAYKIPK